MVKDEGEEYGVVAADLISQGQIPFGSNQPPYHRNPDQLSEIDHQIICYCIAYVHQLRRDVMKTRLCTVGKYLSQGIKVAIPLSHKILFCQLGHVYLPLIVNTLKG